MSKLGGITIYPARGRSGIQRSDYRSPAVLTAPHHRLQGVSDETLAGGTTVDEPVPARGVVVLLPLAGRLAVTVGNRSKMVQPGEVATLTRPVDTPLRLGNPAADDLVNYLRFTVAAPPGEVTTSLTVTNFSELTEGDGVRPVLRLGAVALSVGLLTGRESGLHQRSFPGGHLFVGAAAGAVEVEERLLRERDALTLGPGAALAWECLSERATLVLLETPA